MAIQGVDDFAGGHAAHGDPPKARLRLGPDVPATRQTGHDIRPGVTGWAQVCYGYGASVEDALEKLKYDLFYIKNMSFFMDLTIIARTVKIVTYRSGAR